MKKLVVFLSLFLLSVVPLRAQTLTGDVAVGGGGLFGEEDQTFNRESLFIAAHWSGVDLPLNVGSGLGIEVSFPGQEELSVAYSLWSLNRVDISDNLYTGTDIRISKQNGTDFDLRIVVGFNVTIPRTDSRFSVELYSLEDERPIAFAVLYRF